ncbi:MAG: hypothetical protein R3A51_19860 [Nannocystaceae bacterium]
MSGAKQSAGETTYAEESVSLHPERWAPMGLDAACEPAPPPKGKIKKGTVRRVVPGSFEPDQHFYPRALNAQIHPQVAGLINLETDRLISRYCHLNPRVDAGELERLLTTRPRFFGWAGADLFNVTDLDGRRQMVVIETNSCPSGQKSMPLTSEPQG